MCSAITYLVGNVLNIWQRQHIYYKHITTKIYNQDNITLHSVERFLLITTNIYKICIKTVKNKGMSYNQILFLIILRVYLYTTGISR